MLHVVGDLPAVAVTNRKASQLVIFISLAALNNGHAGSLSGCHVRLNPAEHQLPALGVVLVGPGGELLGHHHGGEAGHGHLDRLAVFVGHIVPAAGVRFLRCVFRVRHRRLEGHGHLNVGQIRLIGGGLPLLGARHGHLGGHLVGQGVRGSRRPVLLIVEEGVTGLAVVFALCGLVRPIRERILSDIVVLVHCAEHLVITGTAGPVGQVLSHHIDVPVAVLIVLGEGLHAITGQPKFNGIGVLGLQV